jgi:tRNA-2-methylthio-N6-dimethylallyladenosine synthase
VKRYHLTTFGCQMNEHDSERIKGMLDSIGYAEADTRGEADLILFNTCSIRETADSRSRPISARPSASNARTPSG